MVTVLITKSHIHTICSLYIKATKPGGKDNTVVSGKTQLLDGEDHFLLVFRNCAILSSLYYWPRRIIAAALPCKSNYWYYSVA